MKYVPPNRSRRRYHPVETKAQISNEDWTRVRTDSEAAAKRLDVRMELQSNRVKRNPMDVPRVISDHVSETERLEG